MGKVQLHLAMKNFFFALSYHLLEHTLLLLLLTKHHINLKIL